MMGLHGGLMMPGGADAGWLDDVLGLPEEEMPPRANPLYKVSTFSRVHHNSGLVTGRYADQTKHLIDECCHGSRANPMISLNFTDPNRVAVVQKSDHALRPSTTKAALPMGPRCLSTSPRCPHRGIRVRNLRVNIILYVRNFCTRLSTRCLSARLSARLSDAPVAPHARAPRFTFPIILHRT